MAQKLRFQAKLHIKFWGECLLTATYIINYTPMSHLFDKSPYEHLFQKPPTFHDLHVFGCLCYAYVNDRVHDKFGFSPSKCIFIGYPMGRRDGWYMTWTHVTFYFTSCWVSWNWISFCTVFTDCKIYSSWLLPTNDPSNVDLEPMKTVPPNVVMSEVSIGSINEDEHPTYVEHVYVLPSTDFLFPILFLLKIKFCRNESISPQHT